jgi:NAD(P)-dependent dehydrogenase (short-subunit alcohol dehydrogenase family)
MSDRITAGIRRALRDAVVVITGASSGIGRATALEFAACGCRLVIAARREDALRETALLCERRGAPTSALATDVTQPVDVDRLVQRTLERYARVDVWVNNAGTTLFGRLEEGDFAAHRQVLETNLLGPMYAARLVMPLFKRQGHGVLINVGSVLSQVGQAFVPAYAISKFGLRGLSEALRSDVADWPRIHVCTVLPYAVDTPHFQEGANVIGRRVHALQPVQPPERVARAIVDVAARPRRHRYVPRYVQVGLALHWLWPRTGERLLRHALQTFHLVGAQPRTLGSLFATRGSAGTIRGSRGPVVGRLAFFGWVLQDLGRMGRAAWRDRAVP